MQNAVFAVLVALPLALIGWMIWRGETQAPPDEQVSAAKPAEPGERVAPDPAPPAAAPDEDATLQALLADGLAGATVGEDGVELYDDKNLFDYINGAAPIFLERNFRRLAAAELEIGDDGELTCDIYDMRNAANAASIFAAERSQTARPVDDWPEAVTGPRAFVFHHDRYYVKLTAFDDEAEAQLPAFARALRERMQ